MSIKNWLCPRKEVISINKQRTDKEVYAEARDRLNEWQVIMYANNRFLHRIPAVMINEKYEEFVTQLKEAK